MATTRSPDAVAATTDAPAPPGERSGRVPLRLELRETLLTGAVDGTWWPQSRDLRVEIADLVDHLPAAVGGVVRLLFSPPDWDPDPDGRWPRTVSTRSFVTKIGHFPRDDTHLLAIRSLAGPRMLLLVIPADLPEDRAREVTRRALSSSGGESGADILARAGGPVAAAG